MTHPAPTRTPCVISSDGDIALLELLHELWMFLRARKKYWLLPILIMLFLLGGLLILTQGSAIAPFIYTLF